MTSRAKQVANPSEERSTGWNMEEYVPDGLTKSEYAKLKREEAVKRESKAGILGSSAPRSAARRTLPPATCLCSRPSGPTPVAFSRKLIGEQGGQQERKAKDTTATPQDPRTRPQRAAKAPKSPQRSSRTDRSSRRRRAQEAHDDAPTTAHCFVVVVVLLLVLNVVAPPSPPPSAAPPRRNKRGSRSDKRRQQAARREPERHRKCRG